MPHVWWFICKLIKRKIRPRVRSSKAKYVKEMNESRTRRLNLWGYRELSFPQRRFSFSVFLFPPLDYRVRVLGSLIPFYVACVSRRSCEFQLWVSNAFRLRTESVNCSHLKLFLISYQPSWDLFLSIFSFPLPAYMLIWVSKDDETKASKAFLDSIWLRISHVPSGSYDKNDKLPWVTRQQVKHFFTFSRYTIKYDLFLE